MFRARNVNAFLDEPLMTIGMVRPLQAERLFPLPADLWNTPGPAADFLRLADIPLKLRQRVSARTLSLPVRLGRMLSHLRNAMDKEANGYWQAADVYWTAL